ncbi:uncharacterized protein CTRU02_206495 [Colletotrichum truncatum]|uniref:Uncharacterized protein n=1 Tax=Colletotrichum truncatum TaxID=5467 RepID=A0ACC3Z7B4_COLTU|nr:uncharacterized protein CTRU02_11867 [Colletotrichum truncatum]KAF6785242.1 hypothetical protein CTRU02_11867 [Colletotrichum truncatum]
MTETVLVFGASGNIGVAAIIGARRANRHVIAVVRNQAGAEKMFRHVGSREGITVVEADVTSEESVHDIVDQVRAGKLPAFQHVWASPGGSYARNPILDFKIADLREVMAVNFESYVIAYHATVPYLLEQGFADSTWTMCTGASGDFGTPAAAAMSQGALYSFAIAASRENEGNAIRFNEVYLAYRVQYQLEPDSERFAGFHMTTCSDFAPLYEQLLGRVDIRGTRVMVKTPEDVNNLKYEKRYN